MATRRVRRRRTRKDRRRRRTRRVHRGGGDGFNDQNTVVVSRGDEIDSVNTLQSEDAFRKSFGPDTPA